MAETAQIIVLPAATVDDVIASSGCSPDEQSSLVRIYPAGIAGSLIPLSTICNTMGRDASCDIELADDFISREHAVIFRQNGQYYLQDRGSLNGTYINDRRISDAERLVPGDAIRLGNHIFKFLSADHIEAQYHEAVYEMMTLDGLTGAHNKRFFEDAIEREILRAERHWRPLALLLFDVDLFKKINDQYGHLAGDECLKQLARRIRSQIRGEDLFARFGGEEFAIALTELTLRQAVRVAQDLRISVEKEPFDTSKGPIQLTISLGVGLCSGQVPMTSQQLIGQADNNLYRAKRDGRNCVRF